MAARTGFQQLTLTLAAVAAIPLFVLVAMLTAMTRDHDRAETHRRLLERAVRIGEDWRRRFGDTTPDPAAAAAFARGEARNDGVDIVLLAPDGRILGDSHSRPRPPADATDPAFRGALAEDYGRGEAMDPDSDRLVPVTAIPLRTATGQTVAVLRLSQRPTGGLAAAPLLIRTIVAPLLTALVVILIAAAVVNYHFRTDMQMLAQVLPNKAQWTAAQWATLAHTDPVLAMHRRLRDECAAFAAELDDLARENRQWEAFFTSMREGIVAVDHDETVIAMNQAAREFLGLTDQRAVGIPLATIRQAPLNHFVAALLGEEPRFREGSLDLRLANGDHRHYRLSGVRFPYHGDDQPGVLVVLHDITALKRLEEMRKDFVGNVSHELKTPVTAIRGFVETLQDCVRDDPERAAHFLAIIQRHTDRINAIIDDLLTLSRLEQDTEGQRRDMDTRSLRQTAISAVHLCQEAVRQRGVNIDIDVTDEPVYANHRLLEQALVNLLNNAVRYSPAGSPVRLRGAVADGGVNVTVQDDGPGIAREHHQRIFERFYRVDKSRDRQTGGTGLGLAIVKHIARLHGGNVTVESTPGAGATFHLRFPRRDAPGA